MLPMACLVKGIRYIYLKEKHITNCMFWLPLLMEIIWFRLEVVISRVKYMFLHTQALSDNGDIRDILKVILKRQMLHL